VRIALVVFVTALAACGSDPPPTPRPPPAPAPAPGTPHGAVLSSPHSTGTSYDDALAVPEDTSALAGEHELTDDDLSKPMRAATFMSDCGVKDSMKVTVKVAVRDGAAIGVTVFTDPDDAAIAECLDKAVRALSFPASKRRDSFTTRY
jgi:hypothetical protein